MSLIFYYTDKEVYNGEDVQISYLLGMSHWMIEVIYPYVLI